MNQKLTKLNWEKHLFWVLIAAGAGLRFAMLGRQSLWNDEMFTIKSVLAPLSCWRDFWVNVPVAHPPLHYLQLKIWMRILGPSVILLRANSALWGSLSLVMIYQLVVAHSESKKTGLLVMALMAASPFHLAYSQELRPYALAVFLALTGFWILESKIIHREKNSWWIFLWGVVLTLLLYTHYWGTFVGGAQVIYGLLSIKENSVKKKFILAGILPFALFVFWIPKIFEHMQIGREILFWTPPPTWKNLIATELAFSGIKFNFASSEFFLFQNHFLISASFVLFLALLIFGFFSKNNLAKTWFLIGVGIPFFLSYKIPSIFLAYRYTSLVYPAFVILIGYGLMKIPKFSVRILVTGIILGLGVWGCQYYFTGWQKANSKDVVNYIESLDKPGTIIVRPAYFADLFTYYYGKESPVLDQDLMSGEKRKILQKSLQIILVTFDVPSDPVADAFLSEFRTVSSQHFPGIARMGITVYSLAPGHFPQKP